MHSVIHHNLDKTRLRIVIALFFVCMAIPTVVLVMQAYSQLKWETYYQYRVMAEELTTRIDDRFAEYVNREEQRSFVDYSFLIISGDTQSHFLQRSPLSEYPLATDLPGLIGYFQIDANGQFSTPLLPLDDKVASYGINNEQLKDRQALREQIQQILGQNKLMQPKPIKKMAGLNAAPLTSKTDSLLEMAEITEDSGTGGRSIFSGDAEIPQTPDKDDTLQLAEAEMEEALPAQAAFDRLTSGISKSKVSRKNAPISNIGRVEDLQLDEGFQNKLNRDTLDKKQSEKPEEQRFKKEAPQYSASAPEIVSERYARKERRALPEINRPEPASAKIAGATMASDIKISIFESEIDPFEFSLLESGHLVLFRKVWRDDQRYIQGILLDQNLFAQQIIENAFRDTALSQMSELAIAYEGNVIAALSYQNRQRYFTSADQLSGSLLYQANLSVPFHGVQLIFSINELPAGAGAPIINWLAFIIASVLCVGLFLMYRVGIRQIALAQQQQDFVSSVSHELKTPLTSIRMYGEMLREGWADEDKKHSYYEYIHDESERLSRLINNVLQLARMTRNDLKIQLRDISVGELVDTTRSKITSQVERAGFTLNISCDENSATTILNLDADFFVQIIINLVDNAIKFSVRAETKRIDIAAKQIGSKEVVFSIRDYGPGISKNQIKKIFKLFYRPENELTRETVGTGIGLALVHKLSQNMQGQIDVINCEPGAEFRLTFPITS